jgi:hypothetical protein
MIEFDVNGFVKTVPGHIPNPDGKGLTINPAVYEVQKAAYFHLRLAYKTDSKGTRAVGRYNLDGTVEPFVRTLK